MRPDSKKQLLVSGIVVFIFFVLWLVKSFIGDMGVNEWIGFGLAIILGIFILYFLVSRWSFREAEESLEYRIKMEQMIPKEEPKKEEKKEEKKEGSKPEEGEKTNEN